MLSLPKYPLNSLYLSCYADDKRYLSDFYLFSCSRCFHVQATTMLSVDDLYNADYSYSVDNSGAQCRQDFFVNRVLKHAEGKKFNRVIELGCFNLSLLRKLKANGLSANHWIGIDPVPLSESEDRGDILFINGYFQNVDIPHLNMDLPDLVISDQVFEHIPSTNHVLRSFSKVAAPDSSFIVCVPSLELMIENFSFHNIIHEHLNYFSAGALTNLFDASSYDLLHSELNNELTIGLLLQIHKNSRRPAGAVSADNGADLLRKFEANYGIFRDTLNSVGEFIRRHANDRIYGFGASDITANLAYFLKSDFSELRNIIDDTPYKQNRYIPHLRPLITGSNQISDWESSTILITAPQASRPIIRRLLALKPKRIVSPILVF